MSDENAETAAMEASSYAVSDVLDSLLSAFDKILSVEVLGTGTPIRARFRLYVVRNLLMLHLKRKLEANAPRNALSVDDMMKHVFDMLQRFGICIQ
jgi:hypothetical protein